MRWISSNPGNCRGVLTRSKVEAVILLFVCTTDWLLPPFGVDLTAIIAELHLSATAGYSRDRQDGLSELGNKMNLSQCKGSVTRVYSDGPHAKDWNCGAVSQGNGA